MMYEAYLKFREENPLDFDEEDFGKIERDIKEPRDGVVSDEYVECFLWSKGLKSRQDSFAEYIERILPLARYKNLLEVGSGKRGRLSMLLSEKGYHMTALDPRLDKRALPLDFVKGVKASFIYGETDISDYDAVIAQEPCEATEHIVRACAKQKKDFVVSLCGVPHESIDGEQFEDVYEWYDYLRKIDEADCVILRPKLIPGYHSFVMVGIYS